MSTTTKRRRRIAPKPKVAAALLAYLLLQVAAAFGLEPAVLGLERETTVALLTFAVMWAVPDDLLARLTGFLMRSALSQVAAATGGATPDSTGEVERRAEAHELAHGLPPGSLQPPPDAGERGANPTWPREAQPAVDARLDFDQHVPPAEGTEPGQQFSEPPAKRKPNDPPGWRGRGS